MCVLECVASKDHITVHYCYDQIDSHWWLLWWDLITQCFWAHTMCQKFGEALYIFKSFINTLKSRFHRFLRCLHLPDILNKREKKSEVTFVECTNSMSFKGAINEMLLLCGLNHMNLLSMSNWHLTITYWPVLAVSYGSVYTVIRQFLMGQPML